MAMVRDSLPSLIQGISQQSPSLRPKAYVDDADNVYGTVVEGITRRPPTEWLGTIPITNPTATHWIVRGDAERYLVVAEGGTLKVFDYAGTSYPVTHPDGWSYLGSNLGFLTVNDYTYVYNRDKVVALEPNPYDTRPPMGLVWLRQGDYSTAYTIRVGYPVSSPTWYLATKHTSATDALDIRLAGIVTSLVGELIANVPAGFIYEYQDNSITIRRSDGEDFLLEVTDDATGKNIVCVKGTITSTTDLPTVAQDGLIVRISPLAGNPKADWWAQFSTPTHAFSSGFWVECPEPTSRHIFDATTMPHLLINNGDGTFTFRKADWANRTAGGEKYTPPPSFVGQSIAWMGALKGRIAITSGLNFVTTRAADPFNFWQSSVQLLEDSDPVDINPSYTEPYNLNGAAEFQAGVLLFSDTVQFIMTSGDIFGPKTISAKGITTYAVQATHGLLPMRQDRVCIATRTQKYSGLLTFQAPSQSLSQVVFDDTSAVVPALMKGNVQWLVGSSVSNLIAMKVDGDDRLFTYKEASDAGSVIQSAWFPWSFPGRVPTSARFIGAYLHLLLRDANGVYSIERLAVMPYDSDELPWDIHLDRRTDIAAPAITRSGATTTALLPWTPGADEEVFIVVTEGSHAGEVHKARSVVLNVAYFDGLFSGPGKVGVKSRAWAKLSQLYFRKLTRSGDEVVVEGDLQLLRGKVSYSKSGPFEVRIKPKDRPDEFAEAIATPEFEAGGFTSASDAQTGTTEFPIGDFNDRVSITFDTGESVMPMRVTSFEWKGDLHLGARPV